MAYLNVQPFLLLAVCCTTLYGIVNECSDLDVFSKSMIGYRLNATYLTKWETSITECAKLCFSYVRCKSFNFGFQLNHCELNVESQSSGSVILDEQSGYYYSDIHLWPKEVSWASTRENLSSGVCEQQRRRPAFASAQTDQRLCYLLIGKFHI